jgi:LysM repeat protein
MPTRSHCFHPPLLAALLVLGPLAGSPSLRAQSLIGSKASLVRQNQAAQQHDYSYLRTTSQVNEFVRRGLLVRIRGNSDYRVADVSFPYARAEVKTFVERLGEQYRSACGERLVVTSLTRPISRQPRNASPLSVHPTGMAIDLRRSGRPACRAFLEKTLLTLEGKEVLEATKENHPPHYHVSLFPAPYTRYLVARGESADSITIAKTSQTSQKGVALAVSKSYRVRSGDSLWDIARRHRTSVAQIKRVNSIRSSRLKPGQVIAIPVTR